LLPVRLFLGITFIYAGAQKLSDPGFLHPGAPTFIGAQLHQFARGTPGGFILRVLASLDPGPGRRRGGAVEIAVGLLAFSAS
jgi:thiosulfate dehydrogenase [quinone] large subunit